MGRKVSKRFGHYRRTYDSLSATGQPSRRRTHPTAAAAEGAAPRLQPVAATLQAAHTLTRCKHVSLLLILNISW